MTSSRDSLPRQPIRSDADLYALWDSIVGEPGFARRCLWLIFLDLDHRPMDVIVPIDGIPETPEIEGVSRLLEMVRGQVPEGTVATMLSRPGSQRIRESDRAWARAIESLLADQRPHWPVHLATDHGLGVFALDDLLVAHGG
ncbi:hypothetical protein [Demetria terragena]|uniref:hypothetical protein n=1 Tax=Demetria terragena TaxID=63959 RepID=UPI000361D1F3|nr:hypothetical protein [Demetria terragena]